MSTKHCARKIVKTVGVAECFAEKVNEMKTATIVSFLTTLAFLVTFGEASPPNIVFLLTDDQDVTANSLDYMPKLNKLLRKEGMEFQNYFVTTALCCPSRTTIIKGQYCHNHGIWDNGDLNNQTFFSGGMKKVIESNLEKETIGTLMQDAGYQTILIGKYLNGYNDNLASHVPPGWDKWHGMTDTAYFGPHFSNDGSLFKAGKDIYQTDYISKNAMDMITNRNKKKPFFIYISPFAPHAPSQPAPRHAKLFSNMSAPRYDSFNPDDDVQSEKPSWLKSIPKLSPNQVASIDEFYRNRLRALQAVDEMLENITLLLAKEGIDKETYLFYMGDNGQHLGDYRLPGGKRQAYDTDIRVPFLARGPGIKGGTKVTEVVLSIDLLPTWVELGGGSKPKQYEPDGKSIVPLLRGQLPPGPASNTFRAAALAEMYGGSSNMGNTYKGIAGFEKNRFWNNTYQAIRVINGSDWAADANWLYAEWCTGEVEFYNSTNDTHQVHNLAKKADTDLLQKLSVLTQTLGKCKGQSCNQINFPEIAREAGSYQNPITLKCHNPPDMPSEKEEFQQLKGHSSHKTYCTRLVSQGLGYSDDQIVPEKELTIWRNCLNIL